MYEHIYSVASLSIDSRTIESIYGQSSWLLPPLHGILIMTTKNFGLFMHMIPYRIDSENNNIIMCNAWEERVKMSYHLIFSSPSRGEILAGTTQAQELK